MDLGLSEKVAIVCASSKGLGKSISLGLSKEGAFVVICARHEEDLIQTRQVIQNETGGEVMSVVADVSNPKEIDNLVEIAIERFDGIDILINNSGGPKAGGFDDLNSADYQSAIDLNLMSTINMTRAVVPSMRSRGGGRIINLTSVSVKQPIGGLMLSNTARAGVIGFAKTLATELASENILVNNVCPGIIFTDRIQQLATIRAKEGGISFEEAIQNMTEEIPLGRIGDPEEFANLVVFLASARASYITGATIQVDGGMVKGLL